MINLISNLWTARTPGEPQHFPPPAAGQFPAENVPTLSENVRPTRKPLTKKQEIDRVRSKQIADLSVLLIVVGKALTIGDIAQRMTCSVCEASRRVARAAERGVVTKRRAGRFVYVTMKDL